MNCEKSPTSATIVTELIKATPQLCGRLGDEVDGAAL
jgi:hypothetical protein